MVKPVQNRQDKYFYDTKKTLVRKIKVACNSLIDSKKLTRLHLFLFMTYMTIHYIIIVINKNELKYNIF